MATQASNRKIPAPAVDPTNKPFFDAAREGTLLIGLCRDTGKHFFYPRGVSPFTLSTNVELVPSKGEGTIYSYSVTRAKEPYAIAYVELAEGPRIVTNIVDCDLDALRIGQKVRLVWKPTEEGAPPVAMFTPA
ncbi:Zn-ribbon domain-containing OB-fold protein [Roseomonas sp. NAR14]|uniref:Zn-ribbon domain-containing OB-fold protein n=1 Tax=Roseomonas acroporae TaxID=2937791 RepID=A0A9X1YAE7_9PROT|nr:Zn-ribbon domain-containing OB-fold protein [Roseomonas acroporae]MCK8786849.1 Zn-ribbon domain-containing OB-fold protein [Roseomonas acroporae]